jgi:hypothetical protein
MAEQAHNANNAMVGALSYGQGKVKTSEELAWFKKTIGPGYAGLSKEATCVLASWLEGNPARKTGKLLVFTVDLGYEGDGSAESHCEQALKTSVPTVAQALASLRAISPSLCDLVEVKGGSKKASEAAYLWEKKGTGTGTTPAKKEPAKKEPAKKEPGKPSTPDLVQQPPAPKPSLLGQVNWKLAAVVVLVAVAVLAGGAWLLLGRAK